MTNSYRMEPLTWTCWLNFARLLGLRDASAGCWGMYWQFVQNAFEVMLHHGSHGAQGAIAAPSFAPALLACPGTDPVEWISAQSRFARTGWASPFHMTELKETAHNSPREPSFRYGIEG